MNIFKVTNLVDMNVFDEYFFHLPCLVLTKINKIIGTSFPVR
jgi:hypothetical protein